MYRIPAYLVEAIYTFADPSNIQPVLRFAAQVLTELGMDVPSDESIRLWAHDGRRGYPLPTIVRNGEMCTTPQMFRAWLRFVAPSEVTRSQVSERKRVQRELIDGVMVLQNLENVLEKAAGVSSLKDVADQKWRAIEDGGAE